MKTTPNRQDWKQEFIYLLDEVIEDMESYIEADNKLSYEDELFKRICGLVFPFISEKLTEEKRKIVEEIEKHMILNAGKYELYGDWYKLKDSLSGKK